MVRTKEAWLDVNAAISFSPLSWTNWNEWLLSNLMSKHAVNRPKLPFYLVFTYCLWELWLQRNNLIFNFRISPLSLSTRVIRGAAEFFATAEKFLKNPNSRNRQLRVLQVEHWWLLHGKSRISGSRGYYSGPYGVLDCWFLSTHPSLD